MNAPRTGDPFERIWLMNRKLLNRQGFTLIEIVIAVAIVAIFAAALSPMVFRHLEDAKLAKAENEAEVIAAAGSSRAWSTQAKATVRRPGASAKPVNQ